jgi:hypothetical protein
MILARAPGTGTTSLAVLFQTQIARAAYNNKYLVEVKAGKHHDLMASVVGQCHTPPALTSEQAGQLVNRRWPAIDLIQNEERLLDNFIPRIIQDFRNIYEGGMTPGASPLEKAEWHRFTTIAGKILDVARWVLAADTGLHVRHKLLTLRYLSIALIHPRCPAKPLALVPYQGDAGCDPVTREAILGYLRLPDPEGTIDRMTTVFHDVYTQIQARRAAEVARRKYTKESLVKSRLTYHTQVLSRPGDDSWMCCICHEKGNVNLIRLACKHELHYDCMEAAGVFGEGPNTTRCPYCRQDWDRIDYTGDDKAEITLHQEAPWNEYDLAGVGGSGW